jgi:hypothetical protein
MLLQKLLGQPLGLLAEHQKDVLGIHRIGITGGSLGGEVVTYRAGIFPVEILYVLVNVQIQMLPVIQPRPLHIAVIQRVSQGFDEMQGAMGGGAGAGDVPRILRDLGLQKDNVDVMHSRFPFQNKYYLVYYITFFTKMQLFLQKVLYFF